MLLLFQASRFCVFLTLLLPFTCVRTAAAANNGTQRPNILFLFADDQRADTIAALGNKVIQTPNLDKLVRAGLSFNRAYMQGANNPATCIPSRAMLLSGRSLDKIDPTLLSTETWPARFGAEGYTTFMSGKWHNSPEAIAKSFQHARSLFTGGMTDPMQAPLRHLEDGKLTKPRVTAKHACETFADEAVQFLATHTGTPFLCYLPFDAPHDPHIVPDSFPVRYDPNTIPIPANFKPEHPFDNGELKIRDELLLSWPRTPQSVREMLAEYYRYISYLDSQIGRVLDALAASKFASNTIVVFSADSGVARGSHGLIGKQNLYEHSVRVPLVLSGPGIPKNAATNAMCFLYDVFPTLGSLCGITPPQGSEGIDLKQVLLADPTLPARSVLRFAYKDVQHAVRDERWKLIRYPKAQRNQLFDLQADPEETRDLSESTEHHRELERLKTLLEKAN